MKLLKAWMMLLGIIPVVILCLIPAYNFAAKKEYEQHISELEILGESLQIADHIPAAVENPDDNFAEEPAIKEMIERARATPSDDDSFFQQFSIEALPGYNRRFGVVTKSVRLIKPQPLNHHFPELSEEEAARKFIEHCDSLLIIGALERAVDRPFSNLSIDYEAGYSSEVGEIGIFKDLAKLLYFRGRSSLKQGDTKGAATDLKTLLKLANHLAAEPELIHALVHSNLREQAAILLLEGLRDSLWDLEDLGAFEKLFREIDVAEPVYAAIRMERARFIRLLIDFTKPAGAVKSEDYCSSVGHGKWKRWLPKGVFFANATKYSEIVQSTLLSGDTLPLEGERMDSLLDDLSESVFNGAHYQFLLDSLNSYSGFSNRFTRTQVTMDQAALAIALERFRMKMDGYPDTLCEPGVSIPLDPDSGKPMIYRKEGESYVIYSVGANGIDEDGLLKHYSGSGDYVWRFDLPDSFDREEYRRRD